MTDQFKPYFEPKNPADFNVWELRSTVEIEETEPEISAKEALQMELEQLRKQASEQGYKEGLLRAHDEIQLKMADLEYYINLLQKPLQFIDTEVSQQLIHTLIWLCEYCIGIELTVCPEKIQQIIEEVKSELSLMSGRKQLMMHPLDMHWISNHANEMGLTELNLNLVEDHALARGDFCLKGEHSELDGRLHSRLITIFAKYLAKETVIEPIDEQDEV